MTPYEQFLDTLRRGLGARFEVESKPVKRSETCLADQWTVFVERRSDGRQRYACIIGCSPEKAEAQGEYAVTRIEAEFGRTT